MRGNQRKSTPQVVRGETRKKNNWKGSENRYDAPRPREVVVDRERPGEGYRHLLTKKDVYDFIALLPEWDHLAVGLNAIVLAEGYGPDGFHCPGVVHVCAWESTGWINTSNKYYQDHADIFTRIGVECESAEDYLQRELTDAEAARNYWKTFGWFGRDTWLCKFTEDAARAYQLLHILLHELGHHHDRMTTRSQRRAARGELYAEAYALKYEALFGNNTFAGSRYFESGRQTMETAQFRRWILSEMKANDGQTKFRRLHVSEWEELQRMEQEGLIRHVPTEKDFLFTLTEQAVI